MVVGHSRRLQPLDLGAKLCYLAPKRLDLLALSHRS
jgi:hypothetical protein